MDAQDVSKPYQETVGATARMLRALSGIKPSLLENITRIVVRLVGMEEPPLRLLLGPDAVEYAKKDAEALKASDEKWRGLSFPSG
jgi:hypothetical protein